MFSDFTSVSWPFYSIIPLGIFTFIMSIRCYNRRRAQAQLQLQQSQPYVPAPPVVIGQGVPQGDAQVVSAVVVAAPAVPATAGANFCSGCGHPLSGPFCSNCGRKHGVASAEA
ncbi:unnamed protein product [Effrenium voratum]|nr:unnamed protein product [Effrenium voratum]CAJ1439565.1 unnamed protein product [Effrenium voratum]